MSGYKLDIFETLAAIDRRDFDFYSRLTDEEKKGFHPPVVLRWASGVKGAAAEEYVWRVNQANVSFWDIYDHPELQYKLLASAGRGKNQFHVWVKPNSTKGKTDKLKKFVGSFWPDANNPELDLLLNQFTHESFTDFVRSAGLTPPDEKEMIEAYERAYGKPAKKPKKASSKKQG